MEQGEYPGSSSTVEAAQGALDAPFSSSPDTHDLHVHYAHTLHLDVW